jgi:cytochrome c-type biogenesis protein
MGLYCKIGNNMALDYLISFSAGVVSVLSPCVLPLIPVVVGHSLVKKETSSTISFVLGFFSLFAVITILTVLFTAAINHYLFYFRIIASIVLIILGGLLVVNHGIFKLGYIKQSSGGVSSSFIMGFITCLAWAPCFGPYLAVIATYNISTGDIANTIINMMLFSLGFSAAILILAITFSKINLEKIIIYSRGIRIFAGFIIVIAGLYMLLTQFGIF